MLMPSPAKYGKEGEKAKNGKEDDKKKYKYEFFEEFIFPENSVELSSKEKSRQSTVGLLDK